MRLYRETERWGRLLSLYEAVLDAPAEPAPSDRSRRGAADPARAARACWPTPAWSARTSWARARWPSSGAPGPTPWRPTTWRCSSDLERLARDADEWAAYAELLTKRLSAGIEGEQERVDVLRRLLRVYVTRLGRVEEARRCSEQILAILPDDEEAERALARILEERKEWAGPGRDLAPARGALRRPQQEDRAALPHRPGRGGRAQGSARRQPHPAHHPRAGSAQRQGPGRPGPGLRDDRRHARPSPRSCASRSTIG